MIRSDCGLLAVAIAASSADPVAAQDEDRGYVQLANEFFLTSSVYPQESGELQLTTTPSLSSNGDRRSVIPVSIEFGLTDRWQIEMEWSPYSAVRPDGAPRVSGVGDLELETQYSFMQLRGSDVHAAVSFGVTFPTGDPDRGTSEGFVEFEPSLALAKDVEVGGRQSQLFGQLGLGLVRRSREPSDPAEREPAAHEFVANAGFIVELGSARLITELNWATNEWNNGGEEAELYATPGLVLDLRGTWELGIGVPLGLSDAADSYRVALIVLYEFEIDEFD